MSGPLDIRHTLDRDDLHIWEHTGNSDRLVACFSGIGLDRVAVPPYEFARSATGGGRDTVLFFSDPHRSWLNRPGLIEQIVVRVERKARQMAAKQIVTLGHSMGGFAAAILPGFTRVDRAVCLSPQASVHPDVAGDDPRWLDYRDRIENHRIRSVADHIAPGTEYYAFFGQHGREAPQRDRFPLRDNINFFVMPRTVHNTPQRMKHAGLLDDIVRFAFQGRTRLVRRLLKTRLNARQLFEPTAAMLKRSADAVTAPTIDMFTDPAVRTAPSVQETTP
jgi:hypothetical protein